ncbi:MAG: ABC transporter ATP-binding protein [Candidatus Acidiferrum sp.]|jgi:peptide/nickel transport system ATP-binding protein
MSLCETHRGETLLSLNISAGYPGKQDVLRDVALDVAEGEILGLVGESGSGKSTLSLAILGLLHLRNGTARGHIIFRTRDLLTLPQRELRKLRGREIALVLQSPQNSLNPALKIATQLAEAWKAHAKGTREACRRAVLSTLEMVSLPDGESLLSRRPSELSVGQAQRVLIALAILHRPALLIADEPTSALDVITQSEILRLFAQLNRELNMSILFISHDLLAVSSLCHRIAILKTGQLVESGAPEKIFRHPQHTYTRQLLAALPALPEGFLAPAFPEPSPRL